ncbi:hypothetical protein C8R43DRAFT_653580 [Mycena crocata]|nr:hypothetical protein C8R43DRAFT_653580 [Mycena crocata]
MSLGLRGLRYYATVRTPARRALLGRYTALPLELFRIGPTPAIILRDHAVQKAHGRRAFDVRLQPDGLVHPKPGAQFEGPNGMSMRPLGNNLHELVDIFEGPDITMYRLPKGLQLPDDLVCLHEHTDHYSMQCRVPMSLYTLNRKLMDLCVRHGERLSPNAFIDRYPIFG